MISQIDLVAAIYRAIDSLGMKKINTRQANVVISAANMIIEEFDRPNVEASPGMGLSAWRASDDTGASSLYIAAVIYGGSASYGHPHDPADFGRCYRLMRAVPGTREQLSKMSDKSEYWRLLVENWDELELLYEEQKEFEKIKGNDKHPLYDRMHDLQETATKGGVR